MAWRQNLGGSEQHLTRAAAAARTRTQRPGKQLAVRASELVVKADFQILRRYRRPLLLRLEHTHRPTLEDYVHRATRLGSSRSLNMRIGISWRERDGPTVKSPAHPGFGRILIERMAGDMFGGTAKLELLPTGAHWSASIPRSFIVGSAA